MNRKRFVKLSLVLLGLLVMLPVMAYLALVAILLGTDLYRNSHWRDRTAPLPAPTIDYLCDSFAIPGEDALCDGQATHYVDEFFPFIEEEFSPKPGETVTREEVDEKLSRFLSHCEHLVKPEGRQGYYVCWYDLQGDFVYPITISYSENNQVNTIYLNLGVGF